MGSSWELTAPSFHGRLSTLSTLFIEYLPPGLARSIALRSAFDFEYVVFMERGASPPKCTIYGHRPSCTWFGLPEPHTRTTRLHIIQTREHGKVSTHMCSYAHYTWKTKAHAIPNFLLCQRTKLFPNVVAKSCKIKQKSTEINPKATLSVQEKEKRGKIWEKRLKVLRR